MKTRLSVSLLALAAAGWPCCGVSRGPVVHFGDQENIVVWDEAHHMEHYVRRAAFHSTAPDFGFLAPTPSVPKLGDADSEAFDTLAVLMPRSEEKAADAAKGEITMAAAAGAVHVFQEQDIAGYHAVTLKATDKDAMAEWLHAHSYKTTKQVDEWLGVYIQNGWFITAFIVKTAGGSMETGLVRMSFSTRQPFNPFYVPAESLAEGESRTHIYFVGTGTGTVANVGSGISFGMSKSPVWTAPVPKESARKLAQSLHLSVGQIPPRATVSYFDVPFDASVRDDLFFLAESDDPANKLVAGGILALLGGGAVWWATRKRESAAAAVPPSA